MDPPCTTFSAAAFPPYRSTKTPLGFNPKEPKTRLGNQLAHACLFLLKVVWRMGDMGDLEQPFLSRMRWLPKYQSLLALPEVSFHKVASCAYGAPWQKYFGILAVRSDLSRLDAKCPGTCRHVVLQGALTGPSAVYWPALAEKWAEEITANVRGSRQVEPAEPEGLERPWLIHLGAGPGAGSGISASSGSGPKGSS